MEMEFFYRDWGIFLLLIYLFVLLENCVASFGLWGISLQFVESYLFANLRLRYRGVGLSG